MRRPLVSIASGMAVALTLAVSSGCAIPGESVEIIDTVTETSVVELGSAQTVEVYLDVSTGSFTVSGGATGLMDAEFTYNVQEWKPLVDYNEVDGKGVLTVRQPDLDSKNVPSKAESNWDIHLTESVPLSIYLDSGVGEVRMNLDGVAVERLDIDQGIGSIDVDLGTAISRDADLSVDGGIGEMVLTIPESVGVRLEADLGVGSFTAQGLRKRGGVYVNDSYGTAQFNVEIRVDAGIGSVTINTGRRGSVSV